ncbi:TetR/AcrR family transcriptional regulator [Streptomyces sp. CB01881]|uniref:TetR/AcrR family transcriptional regulator n=1 Tax=Streptomyces sp. CB01881 TaxID=2078691 RepID=UPI000CDC58A0|nr:TetR/AcrR family transcriptional regulator [Streptomyces sp. CB01881]AUY48613.1 TetR/AcrR family transcriptional regulator [Streptomyces sp. CB01881]TYC77108.1 TetR/AcrR family transcriptional regulator [Streptomyces sp. CB01881]
MPRPPRFDESQLLDAATRLAAEAGPAAVTMAAVAKAAGAPSGSLYHRFPHRPALLAALWLRTVEDFQATWLEALDTPGDPATAGTAAARAAVAWCRRNPLRAVLLSYGPDDFGRAEWPAEQAGRADRGNARIRAAVAAFTRRLDATAPVDAARVTLALVDLPLAIARRHLRAGATLPPYAEELAESTALRLLAP